MERVLSLLTQEWAKAHTVIIAAFEVGADAYAYGGTILDMHLPGSRSLVRKGRTAVLRAIRLGALFRSERPDRIFAFTEIASVPAIIAAKAVGVLCRLYISVRDNPLHRPKIYRYLTPRLFRLPARVIAVSDGVRRALERMGVPSQQMLTIPNPIVPQGLNTQTNNPPCYRRFVLGAGRLCPEKGFDLLLRAFCLLGASDIRLVILGEGPERHNLEKLARKIGVQHRVHFPGRVVDIARWYRSATCFVLSSRSEGRPNVLGEAMMVGCPVVSFDCDYGPGDLIEHGRNGLLVENGNVSALTATISRLMNDPELKAALVAEGRKRASEFPLSAIAEDWLSVGAS